MTPPRFAVDKMLGRLATWLRVLGFDATYGSHLSGITLIRHARREKRLLLTRAHKLSRHLDLPPIIFIRSDQFRDQLRELNETIELTSFAHPLSRCLQCNIVIATTEGERTVETTTGEHVENLGPSAHCRRCKRVCWSTNHRRRLNAELQAMGFLQLPDTNDRRPVDGPVTLD